MLLRFFLFASRFVQIPLALLRRQFARREFARQLHQFIEEHKHHSWIDARRAVTACREDELAVGAVSRADDGIRMAFEFCDDLSGRGVPDPSRTVPACGDDEFAVGAVGSAKDSRRMAFEFSSEVSGG